MSGSVRPSVHPSVHLSVCLSVCLSVTPFCPRWRTPTKLGGDIGMMNVRPSVHTFVRPSVHGPSGVSDHYLKKYSINFKFVVCICWVFRTDSLLSHMLAQFQPSSGQKMTANGSKYWFRPLSEKVLTQPNSNLRCTLVGWVLRIDSILGYFGQILAL